MGQTDGVQPFILRANVKCQCQMWIYIAHSHQKTPMRCHLSDASNYVCSLLLLRAVRRQRRAMYVIWRYLNAKCTVTPLWT